MAVEIFWTPNAVESYNNILEYLTNSWGEGVVDDFIIKVSKTLTRIRSGKIKFRSAGKRNIREVLITKHNLLVYLVKSGQVQLLLFYDTRQYPKRKW